MPTIRPSGGALGASVTGIDLSRPMSAADFAAILRALGQHGVDFVLGHRLAAFVHAQQVVDAWVAALVIVGSGLAIWLG